MSKKSRKKKIVPVDTMQALHHLLRTECKCTEEEITILDAILECRAPIADVEHMRAIFERQVPLKIRPELLVDWGEGEITKLRLTNHPHILLYDYLRETYGERFGTLYWLAFGQNQQEFYPFLRRYSQTPIFKDIINGSEGGQ